MIDARVSLGLVLSLGLLAASTTSLGCCDCAIRQGPTGGKIASPLPPEGDTYEIVGYRDGIRSCVVRYNDNLYRGGDILSAGGAQTLKQLGIKTIVTVTPNDNERALAKEYGFELVEIPFGLNSLAKDHLDRFLRTVDEKPGPIYVHCFGGSMRGAILLAHYRIHREGWSADKAVKEYRRLGANHWGSLHVVKVLKDNAPA